MRILVDDISYSSKKKALAELDEAMMCCEGSEGDRMAFAYCAVRNGCTRVNTYKEIAI